MVAPALATSVPLKCTIGARTPRLYTSRADAQTQLSGQSWPDKAGRTKLPGKNFR
jgi:hypothetical protein